ncbi:MAG: VCBS repeat-containing protein [bacterium]|nr:MAG: VCBS repeat-containing protein [bacterium]
MMVLKRILWLFIIYVLVCGSGIAKEKAKFPTYYKSNPSTRFVQINPTAQVHSLNLSKERSSFHTLIPETLRIMAIRVQFQRDNDRNTTGDGWFDLSVGDSMINPPPHNHEYFSNQLRALRDYYKKVSHGKLNLLVEDENNVGFVYPLESDSAWMLPYEMSYYNPDETEELLDQRLAELFRDAIVVADTNSNIDFSKFNVFIIFHAGVGWEFTQEFDTTPNDIPSVFLNFNDLKKTIGNDAPDFKGIPVNDGTFFIEEGIILPETENQSGYKIFGLLGTAALMMGHQLGLPNLFNTDTGHPGIGRFGLMDQGSGNFFGNIPAQPCAWSKIFLGWEESIVVTSGDQLPVAASLATNPNKIYKIPINAREYFLIENRQRNVRETRDITIGSDEKGTRIEFYYNRDGAPVINPISEIGVIVSIEEYDWGLPGSGILIWHIDENVIERKYAENRVNTDMNHRGVDLVEADGSQDMGYFFNNFGFTGFHTGYAEDMWWDNNEAHLFANSSDKVMFTSSTMPSSHSYSRANTGIYITKFSPIDSIMYFTLEIKNYQPGYPVYLDKNSGTSAVVTGDLNGNGQNEIVAATENGKILVWQANGEKFITNFDSTFQVNVNGDTTKFPLAIFAEINDGQFPFSPSLFDLDQDGDMEVITGSTSGKLFAWQEMDQDADGRAELFFELNCGAPISTVPVIGNWNSHEDGNEIAIGLENGEVCLVRETGELIWSNKVSNAKIIGIAGFIDNTEIGLVVVDSQSNIFLVDENGEQAWQKSYNGYGSLSYPAIGDVNRDTRLELIICSDQGYLIILDNTGNLLPSFNIVAIGSPLSNPTLADIDDDGFLDIVFTGGGKIFAYRYNGVSLTDFPITIEQGFEYESYPDPILVDIDGNGKGEIIVGTKNNQLIAFDHQGHKMEGFPLSVSQLTVSSPTITNLIDKENFHLIARSQDDYCYVWQLDYEFNPNQIYWGQFLRNAQHTGLYLEQPSVPVKEGALMPAKMVYNYPNPTKDNSTTIRYFLQDAADVSIRIYDMAGELVEELPGPGLAGIENEVNWDITNVQSGVYLARVSAKADYETNVAFIKIAVVK